MVLFNKINKIQKNRFKNSIKKIKIKFGDSGIICKNEGRIELIHLSMIKKKLKIILKRKKNSSNILREKVWYFGRFNFYIQQKSKNSRMGKGKGAIERKTMRVKQNFVLFEFKGVSEKKLKNLIIFINKILSVKFYIYKKHNLNFSLWSSKKLCLIYNDKYLF